MKKIICLLLAFALLVSIFSINNLIVSADVQSDVIVSGSCGDNATYKLYNNGELIINGSGKIKDFSTPEKSGWYSNCCLVKEIIINNGITHIGEFAFFDCCNVKKIEIPNSVISIGGYAFSYCGLESIVLPKSLTIIYEGAFRCSDQLKSITIPKSLATINARAFDGCTALSDIYYLGSKTQWKNIEIDSYENESLLNAKKHYASEENSESCSSHKYKKTVKKATIKSDGKIKTTCSKCDYKSSKTIYKIKSFKLSTTSYIYDGKAKKPTVTVKDSKGSKLKLNTDYTVKYKNNKKKGTATATVKFKGNYSGSKKLTFKITTTIPTVKSVKVKSNSYNSIKVSWSKQSQVTGYQIYRSTNKKTWKKVATISKSKTSYTNKKLTTGKKYYYKIRAYKKVGSKTYYSKFSKVYNATPKLSKVSITSITTSSNQAKLKWKKVSGASGYIIYRANTKNGKYKKITTKNSKTLSYTNQKLTYGKTYYYKLRAYKTVDGKKVYGAYSIIKSIKIKELQITPTPTPNNEELIKEKTLLLNDKKSEKLSLQLDIIDIESDISNWKYYVDSYTDELTTAKMRLYNAQNNKTIKVLVQQPDGTWQYEYRADMTKVAEAQEDVDYYQNLVDYCARELESAESTKEVYLLQLEIIESEILALQEEIAELTSNS